MKGITGRLGQLHASRASFGPLNFLAVCSGLSSLQMFESQLLGVQDKLSSVFVEKFEQLQCALDALTDRLTVVEREFSVEKEKQAKEWEEKNGMLSKDLSTIKVTARSVLPTGCFASLDSAASNAVVQLSIRSRILLGEPRD